jgi:hypothetical protein
MERVIGFALYHEASVDQTLSMMGDVQERERAAEQMLAHLVRLRDRVQAELESLVLTRGIEAAKVELADLEARKATLEHAEPPAAAASVTAASDKTLEDLGAEIRRLQSLIHDATDQAVRSLSARKRRERQA